MDRVSNKEKRLWLARMIMDTKDQIKLLETGLESFSRNNIASPAIQDINKFEADGKEVVTTN